MYNMFYNTIYTRYCFKIKFSYEIKIAYVCVMLILGRQYIPWAFCDPLPRSMSADIV